MMRGVTFLALMAMLWWLINPIGVDAQAWLRIRADDLPARVAAIVFESHPGCDPCVIDATHTMRYGAWTVSYGAKSPIARPNSCGPRCVTNIRIENLICTNSVEGQLGCGMTVAQFNYKGRTNYCFLYTDDNQMDDMGFGRTRTGTFYTSIDPPIDVRLVQ
jgi:hypothetical protein